MYVCHVCSLTSPPGPAFQSNQKCGSRQGRGGSLAAAPKNYRPTSTCLKIILATRLSARELSTWRLGRLSAGSFGRGGSVGRQLCIFLCFCAVQSLGRNFWPTDWTMVLFCSQVPRPEFWPTDLTVHFGGAPHKKYQDLYLDFWSPKKRQSRLVS